MSLNQSLLLIALLIAASAFFSLAEISLAASRRLRLRQLSDDGDLRADKVLRVQEHPGPYFTVVQIGLNAVAILGGVVGEGAWSPYFVQFFGLWLSPSAAQTAAFIASFLVTIFTVPGICRPVPQAAGHEQPRTACHAHGGPHAGADHPVQACRVAVQQIH